MGTWGGGIYEDDEAQDARDAYQEILSEGLDGPKATDRFLKEWKGAMKDSDDGPVIWFALAHTQWKLGRLEERVRDAAIRIIDDGSSLDRWREAGPKVLAKRQQVLLKLKEQLLSPQPSPKKIKLVQPLAPVKKGASLKPAELRKQLRAIHCSLEPSRGNALTSVICRGGLTDELLQSLESSADTLERLFISDSKEITAAGLQTIGQFQKLKELSLRDLPLTDKLLETWQLEDLVYLELSGRISDAGVATFSRARHLTRFSVGGGATISGKTLEWVGRLPQLTKLYLRGSQIADKDVEVLRAHPKLQELYLAGTKITDQCVSAIASIPNLTWIDLAGTKITDRAVQALSEVRSLRGLDLEKTAVTDASIAAILKLEKLTFLNVDGTKISKDARRQLTMEHPGLS